MSIDQRQTESRATDGAPCAVPARPELPNETTGKPTAVEIAAQVQAQEKPETSGKRRGAPVGNRNAEKHRGKARVILGRAPSGYGHIYRAVREVVKEMRAEWEAKFGKMPPSVAEALSGAAHWLVRARSLHKWARQSGRTEAEKNEAHGNSAECHDRYIQRLRSIGLAKVDGKPGSDAGDLWAELEAPRATCNGHPSTIAPRFDASHANGATPAAGKGAA
jgi:hypothetical protein